MTRVLLVEDDPEISEPLIRALRREGYRVDLREDGHQALEGARESPDIVVLDLGLPHLDGMEVCRRLRRAGNTVPVLMLTARTDEVDLIVGLDAGADDYVAKPFRVAELMARIRALLRRQGIDVQPDDTGDVQIDPEARRAWFKGERMRLTQKEFDVLRVLIREQGRVVGEVSQGHGHFACQRVGRRHDKVQGIFPQGEMADSGPGLLIRQRHQGDFHLSGGDQTGGFL